MEQTGLEYDWKLVRLDSIHPYDDIHWASEEYPGWKGRDDFDTRGHIEGIMWMIDILAEGGVLRPMAVMSMDLSPYLSIAPEYKYQRLDGFKRYMAHRALNHVHVFVLCVDVFSPGCQSGHPVWLMEGEWATFEKYSRNRTLILDTGRS